MTGIAMSPRDRRVLVLGGAVVLVILAAGRGVPALLAHAEERQRSAEVATQRAAGTEWTVRNADGMRRALGQVRMQLASYDSALVEGATPDAASARLAELVSDAAAETDTQLGSIRLSADTTGGPGALARVTARASVSGELMSVALMLQWLEEGPQLLAVRELSMAQTPSGVVRAQAEVLQVELVVEGLYRRASLERVR